MFSMTITKKHILSKLLVGLSLTLLMWGKADATTFKFKKVADTNTAIPNGSGNFTELLNANASVNHSVVTFETGGSNQPQGIYTYIDGSLTVVVDSNTPIPETTTNFKYFNPFYLLDNGQVVFLGGADVNDASPAVYINRDGSLKVVAHVNRFLPNDVGNPTVLYLGTVSLSKREIVFRGEDNQGNYGIYMQTGNILSVIADKNTAVPDGYGNFRYFPDSALKNGKVAFLGSSINPFLPGVYTYIDGSLGVVADGNTLVPGHTEKFMNFFSNVSIDSRGNVAFVGLSNPTPGTDFEGIYDNVGNLLNPVADTDTFVPSDPRNLKFCSFGTISFNQGNIAFVGNICPRVKGLIEESGIYTNIGGTLTKVIAKDDVLDGKIVASSSSLGSQSLFRNKIVFSTTFTDKSQGIYVATATSDDESDQALTSK